MQKALGQVELSYTSRSRSSSERFAPPVKPRYGESCITGTRGWMLLLQTVARARERILQHITDDSRWEQFSRATTHFGFNLAFGVCTRSRAVIDAFQRSRVIFCPRAAPSGPKIVAASAKPPTAAELHNASWILERTATRRCIR